MPGHKDKVKKKKVNTNNRPAKKNRVKKPTIKKPKNPFQRKNKKKNNNEPKFYGLPVEGGKGVLVSDFVQREQEMNQSPGGKLDIRVH